MFNAIRIALRAIQKNGLRSSLTVLGICIGVTAVIVVTALGTGVRENVSKQVESFGSNFIIVFPQTANASGARGAAGAGARLTEEDGRVLKREAVSIADVAPALRARSQVIAEGKNTSTSVIGTTLAFFDVRSWKVAKGSAWQPGDETTKAKVVVLGTTAQKNLFGTADPIGQMVRIGRHAYRVVGILESKGEAPFGGDQDDIVIMPIASMRARVMRTPPGQAGVLMISATSTETTDRAVAQIDSILRQRHRIPDGREPDFVVRTQKQFQQMQAIIYGVLTLVLVGVAAISLIVGGIGVMNIMLVSVTERTREIGIRMAIGAREADIQRQFLIEAIVLALLGGAAGLTVGAGLIAAGRALLDVPMRLSVAAVIVSVGTSGLTGILFGFFPARRAATLDPIEALRHE